MAIKNLFSEKRKVMSQKSISDITGSATPVESSDYIDNYLIKKERFLPPINFATASNFAKFGSAKQYSADAVQRIHNTYPYDGSLSEKITWLNSSNFYDLYIFNNKYPRTCGYAVFSPLGWGTATATLNGFGRSDSLEYIQLKGGPHPDPSSGSLKLSRQFPAPYNGRANLYDATTGVSRESNLALDLDKGVTVEYWIKGPSSAAVVSELAGKTTGQVSFDLWNGYTGTSEGDSYGRFMLYSAGGNLRATWASGSVASSHTIDSDVATALSDGNWHHIAVTAKQVQDGSDFKIEWNDFLDGNWLSKNLSGALSARAGAVTGSLIANIGAARLPAATQALSETSTITTLITNGTNEGYGKLSGSIDEFRYWKTARTPQQIKRFWNTQIGGGSNTDSSKFSGSAQPVDLGVYYKFNEGNVGNATTDASVLDYSGRISNGVWTGYMTGSSRIAGETSSAMIESSASVSEFKDPIIYSFHPDVSALSSLLVAEGEEWDLQNNMALYHTMPEWITSEDQDKGGEQLKKLTQIIASQLDMIYLQIGALPTLGDKKYPFEEIVTHDPDSPHEANTKTFDYKNSPSPFARNALEDTGMFSQEIFSMANDLATLGNRDEREEFEQKLYDIKNTIYQNIYNNITYIYKSKGTEKSFRNLIRCYGVDDELIKINLYVDNTTYTYADSNYRSTSVKNKYIDFNETDRIQSTIYQSASVSTPNSISYIPGYNPANAATAGATGSAMTFEADIIFPHKFKNDHVSNLWYDYPYLTSSIFGCHEAESRAISSATCTFSGYAALLNENNTTLTLTQADGTNVVFTTDSSVTKVGSGNLTIGTQLIGSDADATESLWTALNVTIILGNLDMTLSPSVYGGETEITLTQNTGGYAGNTLVVNPVGILAQKSLSSATPRFTGGVGINSGDFSSQYTGLPASITVEGKASLNAQNGTTLTLVNADGTSVNFTTNSVAAYTVPPFSFIVAPNINTGGITTDNHATVALHHAFTQAIGQGTLKMSIVPATISTHTSFQLIQNLPGSSGNTAVTVPTGVSVNSAGDGTNTSFTGGVADQASFQVYALRDVEESQDVRFMLTSSNGNIPTLTSPLFQEVYDNERWMFAVKAYPQSPLEGLHVSGSGTNSVSGSWIVELQGYNPLLDQMQNSFVVSASIPAQDGTYFMNANKRLYAGAHRVNFSGSVDKYTDIKVGSIRVWDDYLSDFELAAHAKDPTNFGRERTYKNSYLFSLDTPPESDITSIPQFETLLLNWTFEDVTGSTAGAYLKDHYGGSAWNGSFEVLDYSSGSDDKWEVDARYKYHYTGRGDWFLPADTTSLVDLNFLSAVKTNLPEVSSGEDTINILTTDDNFFTRDSRPINHYFSFEKNMYQNISEEMLRLFATTVEFNNLVGEPVNRYRQEYKSLGKLREAFFRKVGNVPDFNKFVEFYKWIDGSLGDMIVQLTPMSANISDGIKTVIESHILERNKYWNKFPTLEIKDKPIVGRLKGINELSYDWEHGHAPIKTKATCVIDFITDDPAQLDDKSFTITSTDGTVRKYVFDDDSSGATSTVKAAGPPVEIWVQINGMSADEDFEAQFIAAINSANGHNGKIKATAISSGILLEQILAGPEGNTVIVSTLGGAHYTATLHGGGGADGFINGSGEETNCLWWQQRSEASASFTAGNQVDTDRNVLRRILTSDVTTNKILATGEYTDPTDYPNSGFPNAAEFNLAQDGANLAARTQYKGSTYALRSFSKPYKMESEETVQIHGGINYHANKRRELTKHWAVLASPMGAYISLAPGYTDDLLDCDDVINPSKKEFHSFAIDPGGGFGSGPAPEKGAHFAPFNFVSSSVTTNSSLAETGIDIVNLHDDSYGNSNERPMQGPFTERHVGGMAHRHQDINDTTHTSVTRTENFKVSGFKDVGFFVVPGDYASPGTKHSDQPFDRFYRDGVAKRPVNIRNILTTTDSALSQSALGNYESEIQILNTHNEGGTFLAKMQAATGSDGFYTINSPNMSLVLSDTADTPKLLAVGKTLLDSSTDLLPPYSTSQFNPYLSKNKITERFSAPGDPSTAGDAFGGFGIDKTSNKYSVYNALPWRNRQVRTATNALLSAHTGLYGSLSGSALSATDVTTAATGSFHKTHRNTDYVLKHTDALTAFREYSVYFGAADNPHFYNSNIDSVGALTKMSVSVWFKLDAVSGVQTLYSFDMNCQLQASDDTLRFSVVGTAGQIYFKVTDCLAANTWHHVVLAFDQGDTQEWRASDLNYVTMDSTNKFYPKIWLDGEPQTVTVNGITDWTGTTVAFNDINVGTKGFGNTAYDIDGYIQDISLWNTVLSDDQVSEIYRLPGYDSFGPGDLTRLDYVNTDPDSNQLHAWWYFNNSSTVSDVAPIGNALDLAAKGGTTPVISAAHFLPANYYGTECAQRFDNYYIQHPIPANDFGYAWITASADHTEGCELLTTASFITSSDFGSYNLGGITKYGAGGAEAVIKVAAGAAMIYDNFAGLNYNLLDPVSADTNTLGFQPAAYYTSIVDYAYKGPGVDLADSAGGAYFHILNGLLLHRNGPYGYPSWKQIRGGNHPIVREHKKHNILSLTSDLEIPDAFNPNKRSRARILTNIKQTPITLDYPMVHKVETVSNGVQQPLTLQHTYANNLVLFTHPTIAGKLAKPLSEKPRQIYDEIKDQYLAGIYDGLDKGNTFKSFKTLIYKQTLYPKTENMYLSGSRGRLAYAETAAYISQSKNGEYRTFWRDNLADRRREDGALNSLGYPIHASFNQAVGAGSDQVSKLVIGEGSLSIWPLDVGVGNTDHLSGIADATTFVKGLYVQSNTGTSSVPSSDEYGGTWGELHRDPIGTLFGSMTTAQLSTLNGLSGDFKHFMSDHHFITHPTASQCFNHYQLAGSARVDGIPLYDKLAMYPIVGPPSQSASPSLNPIGFGSRGPTPSNWKTHTWSGRTPWYDSYEDYSTDIRCMGQEYTVLPEFKISEHMNYYIEQGNFEEQNFKFLSLPGGVAPTSADTEKSGYDQVFWKEYAHSDFMEHFEMVQADHADYADMSVIELKCSAIKKLLPYDGFYPAQRTLQLGALMSASYAPFLNGSSVATYGPTSADDPSLKYRAERLQSFLQPFYAPGIMYNTIKSGIAVDYPIHTEQAVVNYLTQLPSAGTSQSGSFFHQVDSASGSLHVVTDTPDFRMPFEALINPDNYIGSGYEGVFSDGGEENKKMFLTAPYYGSSSFYAQWNGTSKPHYRLAINNFAAEVPNFFLKNKTLTTFRSKKQSEFAEFRAGTTYYMDVVLQKSPDLIMNQHCMPYVPLGSVSTRETDCTGWGFGPSYHVTGTVAPDGFGNSNGIMVGNGSSSDMFANSGDPSYAVHAPPYFYGRAVVRLAFCPARAREIPFSESEKFDLDTILEHVISDGETSYFKEIGIGQSAGLTEVLKWLKKDRYDSVTYPAKESQMQISSSINLFGTTFLPDVEFDPGNQEPRGVNLTKIPDNKAWVIHSRWETPVLNFADGTGGGLGPGEIIEDMTNDLTGSWWESETVPIAHQRPLGMWNGFGSRPTGETGISISLKESYPDLTHELALFKTGSLIEACGFKAEQRKVGELATSKLISEAVVAIPFVDTEGERKFFSLGDTPAQSRTLFLQALAGDEGPGKSIREMADKMPRFVFPPHMDFVNNTSVEPFAMYIFEFSHKLSQLDLSRIWQNVMPDIAVTAKKQTSSVQHLTGPNEFFRGNKLPHNTRWMVFKVKQRSATNYFKMTEDSKDDHNFKFNFEGGGSAETYNYNWPYDFFSLVELAKVDSRIGIGDGAFSIEPKPKPQWGTNIIDTTTIQPGTVEQFTLPINPFFGSTTTFEYDTGVDQTMQNAKLIASSQLNKSGDNSMMQMMKKLSGGKASNKNFPTNDPTF